MFATLALLAATSPVAVEAGPKPQDPLQKVRCIREQVTGSLVATRRVCHTLAEWRAISNDGNTEARRIVQPGTLNDYNH